MDANDGKMSGVGNPPPYAAPTGQPGPQVVTMGTPMVVQGGMAVPIVVGPPMGPQPASIVCQSCHAQIQTRVEKKPTTKTHLFALILCLLACWCCVCVPYCVDSCNNADHYCPNCNAYIGSYLH